MCTVPKRIIFTLLYDQGFFCISRNFRPQRVGDIRWLQINYGFARLAEAIDELIILDISRVRSFEQRQRFINDAKKVAKNCFAPIAVGGGLRTVTDCEQMLAEVGDKIVLNNVLFESNTSVVNDVAAQFGAQSIIASVDYRVNQNVVEVLGENGSLCSKYDFHAYMTSLSQLPIGEIYLTNVDADGTGRGLDIGIVDALPSQIRQPIILSGGIGKKEQIVEGLLTNRVEAVSTAHLLNFVNNGMESARTFVIGKKICLAEW